MAIKKAFTELIAFLEENKGKKVGNILDQAIELASAKAGGGGGASTFWKDDKGNVIAIRCFYHKQWFFVDEVEFGAKKSSASGYNSMCKDGVSKWTKQNREAKQAKEKLLDAVAEGEVKPDQLTKELDKIEAARKEIHPFEPDEDGKVPTGYDTLEEIQAAA